MLNTSPAWRLKLMLAVLCAHMSACSTTYDLPASASALPVPALPRSARQPEQPAQCLPTCSANAASDDENWRNSLMKAMGQASTVKLDTTR